MNKERYNALNQRMAQLMAAVHVALPVRVERFDPASMAVDVQPLIRILENGAYVDPPLMLDVRVMFPCYGSAYIRPWLNKGDTGLVLFCDADTDNLLRSGALSNPNTPRMHALEDAFFIGGVSPDPQAQTRSALPSGALVIGAGGNTIAVSESGIRMTGNITINGVAVNHGE